MVFSSTCLLTIQQKKLYRHATTSLSIKYFELKTRMALHESVIQCLINNIYNNNQSLSPKNFTAK